MEINEKIDEIIQQAKEEKAYMEAFDAFEQERYTTMVFVMQFLLCCGIQPNKIVLIVCIKTAESYVEKSTVG